jgi:hypothetical protein
MVLAFAQMDSWRFAQEVTITATGLQFLPCGCHLSKRKTGILENRFFKHSWIDKAKGNDGHTEKDQRDS